MFKSVSITRIEFSICPILHKPIDSNLIKKGLGSDEVFGASVSFAYVGNQETFK